MKHILAFVVPLATSLAILITGCSKEPTPQEKQADSTLSLAKTQLDKGNYPKGRSLVGFALTLDLKLNRAPQLAEEYTLLGRLSTLSAEFDSAIGYFDRAIDQYKSLADRTNARTLLLEIASLHRQMGEERVAYSMYTEARRLADIFKDADGMREIQFAMLPACRALGKTDEETQIINDLLKEYIATGNTGMQARSYYESALSLIHKRENQQAFEPLLKALTLANQTKDSLFVINVLTTLAATYALVGNTSQAFETYTDALTQSDRTPNAYGLRLEMLISVGNIYLRNSQFADAVRFYRAALSSAIELKNKLAEGYLFVQLGHCSLGQGQAEEAWKSIQNAIDVFTSMKYNRGLAYTSLSMGIVYQRAGRLNDAVTCLTEAITSNEQSLARPADVYVECENIALNHLSYYDPLIELLFKLGRNDDAFWYAERKSEQTLFDQLNALELHTRSVETTAILAQAHHARALHVGAERQLAKELALGLADRTLVEGIRAQIKQVDKDFSNAASAVIKFSPRLEPALRFDGATISDVQRQLSQGTVLVRHVLTSRAVYIFTITNSKVSVQVAATDRDGLLGLITEYSTAMRQIVALADSPAIQRRPFEQRIQDISTQLYFLFVRPVESALTGATNVLVAPTDDLLSVPVHALRKRLGANFCIGQFPISYLPTLAVLRFPPATATPIRDIVALGHPGMTQWDVEYELRDIRAFYKEAKMYFGLRASLATLQGERGDVLHLALDFHYAPDAPGNACVFASDGKTRGSAKEVLWGELVTTAVFPTVIASHIGTDIISTSRLLPALFLMNGSSSFIVNEHPASRKTKKLFGEMIYTAMLTGKATTGSYREALVGMINNKESTAQTWAPFFLWGK